MKTVILFVAVTRVPKSVCVSLHNHLNATQQCKRDGVTLWNEQHEGEIERWRQRAGESGRQRKRVNKEAKKAH